MQEMAPASLRTAFVALLAPLLATAAVAGDRDPSGIATFPKPASLDALIALPPDRVDLAWAALLVERDLAHVDPARATALVDGIARRLAPRMEGLSPRRKLRRIAWTVFRSEGFTTRGVGSSGRAHSFASTLATRRGVCYGLSILVAAVGQRLRLPVALVEVPGHVYVRYDDGEDRFNIETTRRGRLLETDFYRKQYGLSKPGYERVLTPLQAIALFLVQTAGALYEVGEVRDGKAALDRAIAVDGDAPRAWYKLGVVRGAGGDPEAACKCFARSLELRSDDPVVWGAKGGLLVDAGRDEEADAAFEAMLAVPAESSAVWRSCAYSLLIDGRFGPAASCFERVIRAGDGGERQGMALVRAVRAACATAPSATADRFAAGAALYVLGDLSSVGRVLGSVSDAVVARAVLARLATKPAARRFTEVARAFLPVTSASGDRGPSGAGRRP